MSWLIHALSIDTLQSHWGNFWQGFGQQISTLGAIGVAYYHVNCHQPLCWRIGKHKFEGTPWCAKHHPKGVK